MLSKEKLARLNELAKKAKSIELTKEEIIEQKQLREEYLKVFRKGLKRRLDNICFVDENGNEIKMKKPIQ